ncbi:MAG: tetratricopeptide repeat protein, partial [Proteobacteria bacterium]|nr:tetratricopeptide repeat protein [Pseudomonadota bacterium]
MAIDRDKIARNALRFIQKGQFQRAIDEYKRVLSVDSRDIRTRLKLIDLYGRAGKTREAIDECLLVAEAYADQGFYLKAIAVYKQALRIDPESGALWRSMGEMYLKQGLVGVALASFKRGVDVLRKQDRPADAEKLLVQMEEVAPENAAIKIHLAELYLDEGKYDAFAEELSKLVLQLRGEGRSRKLLQAVESFYEKSKRHQSVLRRLAELYVDLGEEVKALQVIGEGLAREPADRELRLLALRAHLVLGQLPEARRIALGLYDEDPDDLFILEQLASIAQARGDRAELAQTHKAVAKVYGRRGLHQKEEHYFRQVLEIDPHDAEARLALGEVMAEGTPEPEDLGVRGFDESWEAEPTPTGDDAVHQGLVEAELYLKYGIEQKAAEKLQELTALAPDDIEIRQKLRDLCHRRGDRQGWVREQIHIAELFLRGKRETEALRAYQSILEVEPENAAARKAIQYLKPDAVPQRQTTVEIDVGGGLAQFVDEEGSGRVVYGGDTSVDSEEEILRRGLAEADFFEAQDRGEEALEVLLRLRQKFPTSPHLGARLERLGWRAPQPAEEPGEEYIDLQAEVLEGMDLKLASEFEGFEDFEVSELDDIVREFKSGIADRLDESDYETHYNLGVAYREMGLLDEAAQEFQTAARSPDKARDAYTSLSLVLRDLDRRGDALAALRMALAAPSNTAEDRAA